MRRVEDRVTKLIITGTRPRFPRDTGRLAATLHASGGVIHYGGPSHPETGWIDFGGVRRGRGGGLATRPYRRAGRLAWAVAGERTRDIDKILSEELTGLVRRSGLTVTG